MFQSSFNSTSSTVSYATSYLPPLNASTVVTCLVTIVLPAAFLAIKYSTKKKKVGYQRSTSLASAATADRTLLEKSLLMKQNIINLMLFFDPPTKPQDGSNGDSNGGNEYDVDAMRRDFVQIMKILANKFERMSSLPKFNSEGECIWCPINDLEDAIERSVIIDKACGDCPRDGDDKHSTEVHVLKRAQTYIGEILTSHDGKGNSLPLWRVIVLSPNAAMVRIDHCICDGASAVTLLKEVGSKFSYEASSDPSLSPPKVAPLALGDLSPILKSIETAGDLRIKLLPLKLLWPPNLYRAIKFLATSMSFPFEDPNPLRPRPEDFGVPIPDESCGTVYFPTMKVALFRDIARAVGNGTTVNDILLLCLSIALGRYFDKIETPKDTQGIRLVLPIANPLTPSLYGDRIHGLCNRMTPVVVPLQIPRDKKTSMQSMLNEIQSYMNKVKQSNTPLFMTCMNTFLKPLLTLEKLGEVAKDSFRRASCVYSNVPGPAQTISISSAPPALPLPASASPSTRQYTIQKIQTVIGPHPISIFQVLSYNGEMFFNITLDVRSATQPWILRSSFVEAVRCVADWTGVTASSGSAMGDGKFDWSNELDRIESSLEWGGNDVVFTCA